MGCPSRSSTHQILQANSGTERSLIAPEGNLGCRAESLVAAWCLKICVEISRSRSALMLWNAEVWEWKRDRQLDRRRSRSPTMQEPTPTSTLEAHVLEDHRRFLCLVVPPLRVPGHTLGGSRRRNRPDRAVSGSRPDLGLG